MSARTGTIWTLLALICGLAAQSFPAFGEDVRVRQTFILFGDADRAGPDEDGRGGMAKIAAVLRAERLADPSVFVVHAGDAISPSLLSSFDKGAHMIDLLGLVGLDFFVPGNHEYDFGPDVFIERMREAKFPVYAANLLGAGGKPVEGIGSTTMLERDGVRIGVVGLTADHVKESSSPGYLTVESILATAIRFTARLRGEGADLVVVVAHAGRSTDEALRRQSGADVILSGHDHDLLVGYDGRTAFAESMQDGVYVVALDLDITLREKAGRRTVSWWPDFRIIDTKAVVPDPEVESRVAGYEAKLVGALDQEIGRAASELDSRNASVRGGEAAIGNLFADAVREQLGADVAILNGGGIRGNRLYEPGAALRRRDILTELPFSNLAILLDISGADLEAALEEGFAVAEELTGRFPQVSGLRVRADLTRPAGQRVISVEIGGKPLDPHARYRLATNDFMARGGDGYESLKRAKALIGPSDATLLASRVIDYVAAKGTVEPRLEGRIVVARDRPPE